MKCNKCGGRMFLDRAYSDNVNYEIYCIMCGAREFVNKASRLGQLLWNKERELANARVRSR